MIMGLLAAQDILLKWSNYPDQETKNIEFLLVLGVLLLMNSFSAISRWASHLGGCLGGMGILDKIFGFSSHKKDNPLSVYTPKVLVLSPGT